ncbi:MAG: adenine nucleotide alpha hydrolase [Acidobacteria bacterium]|nr:adenine nucleotide alpha hydrolase [Acidobacteriota bacterium]
MKRVVLAWSSGKDSAWALHVLRQTEGLEVVGLLTTTNEAFDRVAMHAVRRSLLEQQAEAAGLPLRIVPLPWPCDNGEYERRMAAACAEMRAEGVGAVAFGDLFLEDVREYRLRQMAGSGLEPLFPLWGKNTAELAREMIEAGQRARVTCVDPRKLDPSFAGREFDEEFLRDLPAGVDACGENGEFHSFVYASPSFARPQRIAAGEVVERDGFVFADVLSA